MSKNIPFTIETLAIEFNRDIEQIKIALDVLMELEMIVLNEHNVYCVKNFAKHQNIKVKEKDKSDKELEVNSEKDQVSNENNKVKIIEDIRKDKIHHKDNRTQNAFHESNSHIIVDGNKKDNLEVVIDREKEEINQNENKQTHNQINEKDIEVTTISKDNNLEITNEVIKIDDGISNQKDSDTLIEIAPIYLKPKKNKNSNKKKKEDSIFNITDEEYDDEQISTLTEGDMVLGEGEVIIRSFTMI